MPTTNAVPSTPAHAVDRPRYAHAWTAALDAPLTLLVAPAGSGKTVLLSQWAASPDGSAIPVARRRARRR